MYIILPVNTFPCVSALYESENIDIAVHTPAHTHTHTHTHQHGQSKSWSQHESRPITTTMSLRSQQSTLKRNYNSSVPYNSTLQGEGQCAPPPPPPLLLYRTDVKMSTVPFNHLASNHLVIKPFQRLAEAGGKEGRGGRERETTCD